MALLVIAAGLLVSGFAFTVVRGWEDQRAADEFSHLAHRHTDSIELRLFGAIEAVQSIAALFAASKEVERAEFAIFAKVEMRDQPNIQALEWIPRVEAPARTLFESRARGDGLSGFGFVEREAQGRMVPARGRATYYPVYFVEPVKGNEAAIGFDLGSNPARLAALEKARDTGEITATGRITLVQEKQKQFGFLVLQPIYAGGDIPDTIGERREELTGFALGVLRVGDLLAGAMESRFEQGTTLVFDRSAPAGKQRLFPRNSPYESVADLTSKNCAFTAMGVGGRDWAVVHCRAETAAFSSFGQQSWIILFSGLFISTMLAAYLRMIIIQRNAAQILSRRLERSEARYSDIIDNTRVIIQTMDVETGKLIFANQGWLGALGYSRNEVGDLTFKDFLHPDSLEHCKEVLREAVSTNEPQDLHAQFVAKDGTRLLVEGHIVCRRDENGVLLTHGIFSDVTARAEAEAKRNQIAEELTILIDTANAPIFGVNTYGRIDEWNQKIANIMGYAKDEVENCSIVDEFVADDFKQPVRDVLNKALHGEETENYEIQLHTKFGTHVDILLNLTARRNVAGEIIGVVGVGQDITELKKGRAEQDRLLRAIENLDECVVLFDADDRIVFRNAAYRALNADIAEFTEPGTLFEDHLRAGVRAGVMPDGIGREDEWVAERLQNHRNPAGPIEISRQDGMTILVNEQKLPDGGTALVISDMTALKQSQAQVIQASKLATLGEMATGVAHELNQPLNVIRMAAGNSRRRLEKGRADPEYLDEKLRRIEDQTARAAAIIDHMRMFGRKAEEDARPIDPGKAAASALEMMREQLRLSGIEVRSRIAENYPTVMGHEIQLEQVLLNLLSNARDAIESHGGDRNLTLRIIEKTDAIEIMVEDSGGGIPEHVLPRIFEPFYTTKEIGKGTGLGLSVSYGIIRDMGGSIAAENHDGGARFTISLPTN